MARAKRILVIGLGRFGRAVAESVVEAGGEVIGVDTDMSMVDAVRDAVTVVAQVDSVEVDALRAIGAAEVDAAVVAIGEDIGVQILTVAVLKELGVPQIVARAKSERERRILELVGATRVIALEAEMGQRVARSLVATDVLDHVSLGDGVSIVYWTADDRVIGRRLAETDLRSRWHLSVVGIRRAGADTLDVMPSADDVFQAGDVLLLAGSEARLAAFTK